MSIKINDVFFIKHASYKSTMRWSQFNKAKGYPCVCKWKEITIKVLEVKDHWILVEVIKCAKNKDLIGQQGELHLSDLEQSRKLT